MEAGGFSRRDRCVATARDLIGSSTGLAGWVGYLKGLKGGVAEGCSGHFCGSAWRISWCPVVRAGSTGGESGFQRGSCVYDTLYG